MKAKEVKKILGVTQQTLRSYIKLGKLRIVKINDWHYEYNDEDVYKLIGIKKEKHKRINISYSRVSNNEFLLKEQSQMIYSYCINKGIDLDKQIEDVSSSMDFNRKGLKELLQLVIEGRIEYIILENSDRLCRFSFELLEQLFKYYGTKIIVINNEISNRSYEQELTDDLILAIDYFSKKDFVHNDFLNKIKKELISECQ